MVLFYDLWYFFMTSLNETWHNAIAETIPIADARVIIYACGLLISVPFFILTIAAYVITPRLRDIYGKALCHYCGCLAVAFSALAITQLSSSQFPPEVCISMGKVINYPTWRNVYKCDIATWKCVLYHNYLSALAVTRKPEFFAIIAANFSIKFTTRIYLREIGKV